MTRTLRRLSLATLVSLISFPFAGAAIATDCELKAYGEVTLTPGEHNRSLFPVTVDGHHLMADFEPAVTLSQIQPTAVAQLDKFRHSAAYLDYVTLGQIVLGKLTITATTADVVTSKSGADISFGQNVMKLTDLELDIKKNSIRLFPRNIARARSSTGLRNITSSTTPIHIMAASSRLGSMAPR